MEEAGLKHFCQRYGDGPEFMKLFKEEKVSLHKIILHSYFTDRSLSLKDIKSMEPYFSFYLSNLHYHFFLGYILREKVLIEDEFEEHYLKENEGCQISIIIKVRKYFINGLNQQKEKESSSVSQNIQPNKPLIKFQIPRCKRKIFRVFEDFSYKNGNLVCTQIVENDRFYINCTLAKDNQEVKLSDQDRRKVLTTLGLDQVKSDYFDIKTRIEEIVSFIEKTNQ